MLEASQSLWEAFSEISANSWCDKFVKLNKWVTNVLSEVRNQKRSGADWDAQGVQGRLQLNARFLSGGVPSGVENDQERILLTTVRVHLMSLTVNLSNNALELVDLRVLRLSILIQFLLIRVSHRKQSPRLRCHYLQQSPTKPNLPPSMAQQIYTLQQNSRFFAPVNHTLPKLLSMKISSYKKKLSAKCYLVSMGLTRLFRSTKHEYWEQRYSSTRVGTVYYLSPSGIPNIYGKAVPFNVSSTAAMIIGGPIAEPDWSIALIQPAITLKF